MGKKYGTLRLYTITCSLECNIYDPEFFIWHIRDEYTHEEIDGIERILMLKSLLRFIHQEQKPLID